MNELPVSVIIASYNRAGSLRKCLESLDLQTYRSDSFEIIVVDDGSTDETGEMLQQFKARAAVNVAIFRQANSGVSVARNAGIAQAQFEHLAFTDDDCILPPDWLQQINCFWSTAGDEVAGIGGPLNTITANNASFVSCFLHYIDEFNHIPVLTSWLVRPIHISRLKGGETVPYLRTSNATFKKKFLQEISGFDPAFRKPGGEDPDLCYRLMKKGYRFQFEKTLVVGHHSRESLKAYFRTLSNYVTGEVRQSRKRDQYPAVVARSYRFVVLQKVASLVLSLVTLPSVLTRSVPLKDAPVRYSAMFPFVLVMSKVFALTVAFKAACARAER